MTIKEIAQLAGVSITTVSRIINNKDENINPQTRSRVLKIVKEYNYTPYGTAKNISNVKKFLIGVLLRTDSSLLVLSGIMEIAQEYGYSILLLNSQDSLELEAKYISVLCSNHVDGIIWDPISEKSSGCIRQIERQNIPFCFMRKCLDYPSYQIDYSHLGYILTKKLIDYQHTNIVCLLRDESFRSKQLLEGFQKCLYEHRISYTSKMCLNAAAPNYCQHIIDYHISGIICSDLSTSIDLYEQMNKLHRYLPVDYSLVCLKEEAQSSYPHISGIRIPYQEFGRYVGEQLIQMCEKTADSTPSHDFISNSSVDTESSLGSPSSLQEKRFVVVGSIHLDTTFHVDLLPQHGKTTAIHNSTSTIGGKGANQAVGIAKLKHNVSLIGKIGSDTDSSFVFNTLSQKDVATQGILRDKKKPIGKAYIYADNSGESAISILSGANSALTPKDIHSRSHLFENAGYCLVSTEIPLPTAIEAAKLAQSYDCKTILKPAALNVIPSQLLQYTDIFVPNRKEASALCPTEVSVEAQADYFFNQNVPIVIITLGHSGCYLKTKDTAKFFPAADFISVDTTGGADAFISALAVYLIEGYSLERSIEIATCAAGFCVSRQGAVSSLIDKDTLEAHLAKTVLTL